MNKIPEISIIIPVYNTLNYLPELLDSIMVQTYKNFEVIIVDDGSTDGSLEYLLDFMQDKNLITLYTQEHKGAAAARNFGVSISKGDFVLFVDSDDELPKEALEILISTTKENEADITIGVTKRKRANEFSFIQSHVENFLTKDGTYTLQNQPGLVYALGPCGKIFKRELIKELTFPEHLVYGEDQLFVLEAYAKSRRINIVSKTVYHYKLRYTKDSATQQIKERYKEYLKNILFLFTSSQKTLEKYYTRRDYIGILEAYYDRLITINLEPLVWNGLFLSKSIQKMMFESLIYLKGVIQKGNIESFDRIKMQIVIPRLFLVRSSVEIVVIRYLRESNEPDNKLAIKRIIFKLLKYRMFFLFIIKKIRRK